MVNNISNKNIHEDDCGEHPPAIIPTRNDITGSGEILTIRAKCVRSCSRFCKNCSVCKFKCGHTHNMEKFVPNFKKDDNCDS